MKDFSLKLDLLLRGKNYNIFIFSLIFYSMINNVKSAGLFMAISGKKIATKIKNCFLFEQLILLKLWVNTESHEIRCNFDAWDNSTFTVPLLLPSSFAIFYLLLLFSQKLSYVCLNFKNCFRFDFDRNCSLTSQRYIYKGKEK